MEELNSDENMKIIHLKSDRKDKKCISLTEHWRHERERDREREIFSDIEIIKTF